MAERVDKVFEDLLNDAYDLAAESASFMEGDIDSVGRTYPWTRYGTRSVLSFNAVDLADEEVETLPEVADRAGALLLSYGCSFVSVEPCGTGEWPDDAQEAFYMTRGEVPEPHPGVTFQCEQKIRFAFSSVSGLAWKERRRYLEVDPTFKTPRIRGKVTAHYEHVDPMLEEMPTHDQIVLSLEEQRLFASLDADTQDFSDAYAEQRLRRIAQAHRIIAGLRQGTAIIDLDDFWVDASIEPGLDRG